MADKQTDGPSTLSRREFFKWSVSVMAGLGVPLCSFRMISDKLFAQSESSTKRLDELIKKPLREAMFYQKSDKGKFVQCHICFRRCQIPDGFRGICTNKINLHGTLYNLVHARPSAVHIDPVEKEPQYHMLPGSEILCLGTAGCNFHCKHCHNWTLSQSRVEDMDYCYELPPEKVVEMALKRKIPTISFTYNDPIAFYEYVYDVARLAKPKNLKILWHSNGSFTLEPLQELLKYTDAVTIDLKGFSEEFYKTQTSASLAPVLETLKAIKKHNIWLEIVNLVIPTRNDDTGDIRNMCRWIREHLGADVPLHFSRFSPTYKMVNLPYTPIKTLEKAYQIAREVGINYISIGNVPGHEYNSTFCPKCQKRLIHRTHFQVLHNYLEDGKCKFCGHPIPGIWK
ncbi:MAG: AmmeMemoRadiSam system radical SAM enzyme [Planctomycetota bacterium]|nr:AmmeMemoRadiSam system radical SAM enzyme [Planctomycetota bacterium]